MSTANREEPSISLKPRQLEPGRSSSFASPLVPPTTRGRHARLGQTHGALSQDYHQAKHTSSAFTTDGLAAGDLSMKPVPTKHLVNSVGFRLHVHCVRTEPVPLIAVQHLRYLVFHKPASPPFGFIVLRLRPTPAKIRRTSILFRFSKLVACETPVSRYRSDVGSSFSRQSSNLFGCCKSSFRFMFTGTPLAF